MGVTTKDINQELVKRGAPREAGEGTLLLLASDNLSPLPAAHRKPVLN
jgi:hypothetical protein